MSQSTSPQVYRYAESFVPTREGKLKFIVYRDVNNESIEHCAIVHGELSDKEAVPVRLHSECFTGEVMHSLKCDCREQLDFALQLIAGRECGAVLYLKQEGRGIGLGNKIRAYALQDQGLDTVDANRQLGFADDLRRYDMAADMLRDLRVKSVELITNNPHKIDALRIEGIQVVGRIAVEVHANPFNRNYIETKEKRMGHLP